MLLQKCCVLLAKRFHSRMCVGKALLQLFVGQMLLQHCCVLLAKCFCSYEIRETQLKQTDSVTTGRPPLTKSTPVFVIRVCPGVRHRCRLKGAVGGDELWGRPDDQAMINVHSLAIAPFPVDKRTGFPTVS